MSTLIDLFILLSLVVGMLTVVAAGLFGLLMLYVALWDLLLRPEPEWDYDFDAPFNMDEGEI